MHFSTVDSILVVLESGLGLESRLKSVCAGLGLALGKICDQVHFQFSLCTFAVLWYVSIMARCHDRQDT